MRTNRPLKNSSTIKKIGIYSWSTIGFLIIVVLVFYVLYRIRIAVIPLILAAGIAYLLAPFVTWMSKKMKRGWAILIAYIVFTGFFFVLFFFGIPAIINQFQTFIASFPSYVENLTELINNFISRSIIVSNIENMLDRKFLLIDTNAITNYIMNTFSLSSSDLIQNITTFTRSIVNILITLILGPLLSIYILKDAHRLRNIFITVLPRRFKRQASDIIDRINNVGGRYIRAQILVSIIVGLLCTLVLFLLKVDFALLLGFIAGFFNLIPFLGPIIGAIPAALAALFISPLKALLVILLFIGIQQLDNYVISPNIMKYQIGVHPAIVIFVLIASGAAFGFLGLLIAVPFVAVLQAILSYYFLERKKLHHDRSP
jgi:predicted PurR-regulated permease PerM